VTRSVIEEASAQEGKAASSFPPPAAWPLVSAMIPALNERMGALADSFNRIRATRFRLARADLFFYMVVLAAYATATAMAVTLEHANPDRMMLVAERALGGHLDSDLLKGTVDTVNVGGRYYLAQGPLQLIPYLPFAAVPALQGIGRFLVGLLFGIPAAWLALPLARAFGAKGKNAYWIAAFTAFGSLLFYASVIGSMYAFAHAESFLALTLFLLEWAGRRRPAVLGAMLAVSFLARPTTLLAAVPFGLAFLWNRRLELGAVARGLLAFGAPIAAAIAVYGWFNWVRFGSPLESGYAISILTEPSLEARRAMGIFSLGQVPENLRLALLALPSLSNHVPFLIPSPFGMSMLLVSPALLASAWAGIRDRTAQLLWLSAALVAVPIFLYYGGGYIQYGFRYSLDFTPFLVALMAIGSRRWIGLPERILVAVSIGSVYWGVVCGAAWKAS
jgi:hypothetical protein